MTDRLSFGLIELYQMLSIKPPITKDMNEVRLDVEDSHTVQQLISFLEGKDITNLSHVNKPLSMGGSLKQTFD